MALFDHLRLDLRFAFRQLRRTPAFAITAILVLALGLSASVAIFAFVDAAVLKPLPYHDAPGLAAVYERIPLCERCNLSFLDYKDWKRMNKTLQSLDVYGRQSLMIATPNGAEQARGGRASAGFFRTLGVSPMLGRDFADGEDQRGAPQVVMLSYSTWQTRFGGNRDVIGRTVAFNDNVYNIIGVLPAEFHFAPVGQPEFWTTIRGVGGCEERRSCHNLYGVGRLKDGVTLDAAAADFQVIARQLETQYPDSNRGQGSNIVPLSEVIVGRIRPILIMLLAGSALLLLISAVNVASLLLVRSEGRKREIAVRSGLGASASRLAAQFVTEGLLLSLASAAAGLLAARWMIQVLLRLIPQDMLSGMPYLAGLGLHWREYAFAAAISLASAILFTLTPLVRLSLSASRAGLAESSRGHSGAAWRRVGSHMVIVELATAVVLLTGAGLLGKSLYRVLQVDLGMRPDHLATMTVAAPQSSYSKPDQFVALHNELLRRVAAVPGIESVATASTLPVSGGNTSWIKLLDRPFYGEHNESGQRQISPAYFTTLGAKLLHGRYFTDGDTAFTTQVVIVDHSFADKYYPGRDAVGQQIAYQNSGSRPMTIVGVVENIKEGAIDSTTWPTIYTPFAQEPDNYFSLVVRTSLDEHTVLPALAETIHGFDRGIMTGDAQTMGDRIDNSPAAYLRRSSAWLAAGFAVLALVLGVVGLYGVIAYSVSQRTREIGVRIALGAQPSTVYRLIMNEAAWLVGIGVTLGLVCSIGAAALLQSLLFGTKSWDAPTFAGVAIVLGLSALAASFVPARRAASVNPVEALRAE